MKEYLTVTALNKYLKYRFENDPHLNEVYLEGEITNFKKHTKGHLYFTLKDETSQIQAIMFKTDAEKLNFELNDGIHVFVIGKVTVFEANGNYQIYVHSLEVKGLGNLYLQFQKLKVKLEDKGYFKPERKKKITKFPKKIGVITSDTGAVIRDIMNTINRRYPYVEVILYPCLVQGTNAKFEIVKNIKKVNQDKLVDTIILARGGGSFEDLYCFNEEIVASAIYESKIPIISAVGHETDFTIADFVADLRAPTPTAAAELAVPNKDNIYKQFIDEVNVLKKAFQNILLEKQRHLMYYSNLLEKYQPDNRIKNLRLRQENLKTNLDRNIIEYIRSRKENLDILSNRISKLNQLDKINLYKEKLIGINNKMILLNPLTILNRGFALVKKDDLVITTINQVSIEDNLTIRLKDGNIYTKVLRKDETNGEGN